MKLIERISSAGLAFAVVAFPVATMTGATEFPLPRPKPTIPKSERSPVGSVQPPIPGPKPGPRVLPEPADKLHRQVPPLPRPKPRISPTTEPAQEEPPSSPQLPFDLEAALACERELTGLGVVFAIGEDVTEPGPCGLHRPIQLKSLKGGIEVTGNPIMQCKLARALALWMAQVVMPSAQLHLKAHPTALHIGTSYQCRNRNGAADGKISEHAFGDAVDIIGLSFVEREDFQVEERRGDDSPDRPFQAAIRGGACAYFTTVLGPTTNAAHKTHFHFDLIARHNGYRLCE